MRSILGRPALVLAALLASLASPLAAQLQVAKRGGAEIVANFITGSCCDALVPTLKPSVDEIFKRGREQATKEGVLFRTIGVSADWSPEAGWEQLKAYGSFDEVNVGGNWLNMTMQSLVWRDSTARPVVPQLVILRYTVDVQQTKIGLGERTVVQRLQGWKEIQDWALGTAPIP